MVPQAILRGVPPKTRASWWRFTALTSAFSWLFPRLATLLDVLRQLKLDSFLSKCSYALGLVARDCRLHSELLEATKEELRGIAEAADAVLQEILATLGQEKRLGARFRRLVARRSLQMAFVDKLRGWPEALRGVAPLGRRQGITWAERTLGGSGIGINLEPVRL